MMDIIIGRMERQKLAEMVLARMRERKEEEERNRPDNEVLRLEATFARERNQQLRQQIGQLEQYLQRQKAMLAQLQEQTQDLDNTGKRPCPRIIVKPDFIASERIDSKFKEFYRKSGNTFLRHQLLRIKEYEVAMQDEATFLTKSANVANLSSLAAAVQEEDTKNINKRRLAILKQQLRLRKLKAEQSALRSEMQAEEMANSAVGRQYKIKRELVESGVQRMQQLEQAIHSYKQKIEAKFNPEAYREYLRSSFAFQIKNQALNNSLQLLRKEIRAIHAETAKIGNKKLPPKTRSASLTHAKPPKRVKTEQKSTKHTQLYTEITEHHKDSLFE